ncbi:MAG: DUF2254 family protein [Longimicrobiaceae bacterium]
MKATNRNRSREGGVFRLLGVIRRAFEEFLTVPACILAGFLLLAAGSYTLDQARIAWLEPLREALKARMFADAGATSDLLGIIASGIITVTSITISLLLLAVQQAASSLTHEVFDQFLRRRSNQLYFGYFIGLAVYTLVTLATVADPFNPVLGATVALVMTVVALLLLLLLLYSAIDQMRPAEIVDAIHRLTLDARERQLSLVRRTRRSSRFEGVAGTLVEMPEHGFVTRVKAGALAKAVQVAEGEVEVVLKVAVGSYVAFGDAVAEVKADTSEDAERVGERVLEALVLERQRDVATDPDYGVEQLEVIAWTSISTANSDPGPGLLAIRTLRDLLARWSDQEQEGHQDEPLPVVYEDNLFARLLGTFESLAVVASESMQHQSLAELLHTVARTFERLPPEYQPRAEELVLRTLPALGDHVLTARLESALDALAEALASAPETAAAVRAARDGLRLTVGELNSRATRVESKRRAG